jgi:hypothetical protein
LSGNRVVSNGDTHATSADDALNEAPLDRVLDHGDPVQAETVDVEAALAKAIGEAAAAGRFDVVALLAGELQARRLARVGVATLDAKKRQRGA